jgi:hypothetical protein
MPSFLSVIALNLIVVKTKSKKKSRARSPAPKIVSTLNFLENLDLILIIEATLLVRVRAPPETWTTKLNLSASLSLNW